MKTSFEEEVKKEEIRMQQPPEDEFIQCLYDLKDDFPEFEEILQLLIDQIEKGKESKIQEMLQRLSDDDDDWD